MRKQYTYRSDALRFRRWSRKGYAAFISVRRAVTIGQLSADVSDRSLVKGSTIHTSVATLGSMHNEEDDEEAARSSDSSGGSFPTLLLLETILPQQTAGQSAEGGACIYNRKNFSEIAGGRGCRPAVFRNFVYTNT